MSTIHLIATGVANTASVAAAFRRLGCTIAAVDSPQQLTTAGRVVLPGVGTFGAAAAELTRLGLFAPLRQRLLCGRPTLAICVGLQLMAQASDESPGATGFGVLAATVRRFPPTVTVPQLGWNHIEPHCDSDLPGGCAFFANSFRLEAAPAGWAVAYADHGGPFVAMLQRDAVLACQFHPELSGDYGASLLQQWLDRATEAE